MRGTVLAILKQATSELGLPVPQAGLTSPETSTIQLLSLLNSAGNELMTGFEWEFVNRTWTISTVAGEPSYPFPEDYDHMVNQTQWDKTNRRPMMGPISSQGWSLLTNSAISSGPSRRYRINDDAIEIHPTPGNTGDQLNVAYISNGWVKSYMDPDKRLNMVSNDLDVPLFDFWVLVKFLKLKMWQAKGLDTTTLQADFDRIMDSSQGQDHAAPKLSLSPKSGTPYITSGNIPDGNWQVGV